MAIIDIKESITEIKDMVWGLLALGAIIGSAVLMPEHLILPIYGPLVALGVAAIAGIIFFRVRLQRVVRELPGQEFGDMVIPASLLSPAEQRLLRVGLPMPHASHVALLRERLLLMKYLLKPLLAVVLVLGFAIYLVYFE